MIKDKDIAQTPVENELAKKFLNLVNIIAKLRDPNGGCPWDLEQSHESLKPYLIEEAYEVLECIDSDPANLSSELGDVLLQVMLHSQIGKDNKNFDVGDVITKISDKLIKRHPHVFGDVKVDGSKDVLQNWEKIKKQDLTADESMLDGIPKQLPALLAAHRIGVKVARIGFDWNATDGIVQKVKEELLEFLQECVHTDPNEARVKEELGDLLFTMAQLARKLGFDAEDALAMANTKFKKRFKHMEQSGKDLAELTPDELEGLWQKAKVA